MTHPVECLTPAEMAVALLLAEDFSNKEIAFRLNKSPHTVKEQKRTIFYKLCRAGVYGPARLRQLLIDGGRLPTVKTAVVSLSQDTLRP
jgi:DNA-binding NarL/FixJ family response regulator